MRILVTEDERDLADALARGLERQGYAVDVAYDGEEALRLAEVNDYDLIVLDLNLPKVDGMEVCRKLRDSGSSIDDYLVKPFHFPELLARVRSILRREGEHRKPIMRTGELVLDPNAHRVSFRDSHVVLTAKEFGILEYLMRNVGCVVSQEELLEHVWSEDANLFTQSIKVHINNLRRKLDAASGEGLISTIKGKGYLIG
jgi:DNA-binding response OmpR family regulator